MLLKYVYDDALAQASYLVGCAATGEALVVDPSRDIRPYLNLAAKHGLKITHVTETHIHADYVSGSRELAAATGATLYLSAEGGPDWQYDFAGNPNIERVRHGAHFKVGNILIEVLHTPGHTPEHISFLVTDTAGADRPIGLFTGDFIFAGDVGRPDLLENAAGIVGSKEPGARQMFDSLQAIRTYPDYLQIWPGHGAGSACGKALGAIPSTTLGYEKLFNPAFQIADEDQFVAWLLDGQPEPPRYFAEMKRINKLGPALLADLPTPQLLTAAELSAALAEKAQIFDLRRREINAAGFVPGTLSIPATSTNFSTYVGWFVDYPRPLYLIVQRGANATSLIPQLRAIGVDNIAGYFTPAELPSDLAQLPEIDAKVGQALPQRLLDVRNASERTAQPVSNSDHIPLGFLPQQASRLSTTQPIVALCASGYRSHIAVSWLHLHGFTNAINLTNPEPVLGQTEALTA